MSIQDFGEKIGGAKKDLWKQRGLMVSDLDYMNDAEQDKYIRKDNIWKKPDYEKLVSEGIPVTVVYFIKLMRDSLPTKPVVTYLDEGNAPEKRTGYIDFVSSFRDKVMSLRTENEVESFYWDYLAQYLENPKSYRVTLKPEAYDCITNKTLNAAYSVRTGLSRLEREIQKKQFCFTEEQKLLAPYTFLPYDSEHAKFAEGYHGEPMMEYRVAHGTHFFYPKGEWADPDKWKEGTYFALKGSRFEGRNFESLEAAKNWALERERVASEGKSPVQAPGKRTRKKSFIPKQLARITREGEDVRRGTDIAGQDYLNVFGFRGGEFGNWMSDKDRQASLNFGYEGLLDMCRAIGISPKDVSLGGRLSIAFGARGSGNALAHYEPLREVINLTKMKGAGSLAHEWGHALDDIIGKGLGLGGMMTEKTHRKEVPESFRSLIDSFKYKEVRDEESLRIQKEEAENAEKILRRYISNIFDYDLSEGQAKTKDELISKLIKAGGDSESIPLEMIITGKGCTELDALSEFRKNVEGRLIPKAVCIEIGHLMNSYNMAVKRIGQERKVKTDFYENSAKFDSLHSKTDHGYYQSTPEMFARAFACYVKDKLEEMGCHSDYICGHADMSVTEYKDRDGNWKTVSAVPEGEERRMINKNFDMLFEEMRELGMLHPYERSPDPKELSNYSPSITELLQKGAGEDKNISLDERIRQSKEKENYLDRNIHDNGKGQYEFNLFQ